MTNQEHAEKIRDTLLEVERLDRKLGKAIVAHHAALQASAAESGAAAGIEPQFGEPKPDPE